MSPSISDHPASTSGPDEYDDFDGFGRSRRRGCDAVAYSNAEDGQDIGTQVAVHFALPPTAHSHDPCPDSREQAESAFPQDDNHVSLAPSSHPPTPAFAEMILYDPSHEHIEIVLPSDSIVLRGVGQDVEPTLVNGHVVLRLLEDTNIREINLNFTGKAKLPQGDLKPPTFRQPTQSQVVYAHDWSLLEGTKSHKHTLKAGKHVFPFQLNIDDTFPSSVTIGSSSIQYRLRATVVRSSLTSNWVAQRPIVILRSFSPEALEFNQTLEIENTWPGKIMYSVMIPHKAFAAGDFIPVSLKFTPLVKGCSVVAIEATVKQYLSIKTKAAVPLQDARTVAKANFVIQEGRAVELSSSHRLPRPSPNFASGSGLSSSSAEADSVTSSPASHNLSLGSDDLPRGDNEIDTSLRLALPSWATPSNMAEPITVHHKVKWSITLSNLDGHTSELRCALPIHVLSNTLLDEARAASHQTRAVLFGADDAEEPQTIILPSYASHVHDRVANALDDLGPSFRLAPNPLHNLDPCFSAFGPARASPIQPTAAESSSSSGLHPPAGLVSLSRTSTGNPSPPTTTPPQETNSIESSPAFNYIVDTGLLLSIGSTIGYTSLTSGNRSSSSSRTDTPPDSRRSSFRASRISSRTSSRATSPEPSEHNSCPPNTTGPQSSRSGLFQQFSRKSFGHFAKGSSRNGATKAPQHHPASNPSSPQGLSRALGLRSRQSSSSNLRADAISVEIAVPGATPLEAMSELLSRVPNYERASQGILGGGLPPIDVAASLPTYSEIERIRSDGALSRVTPRNSLYDERPKSIIQAQETPEDWDCAFARSATPKAHQPIPTMTLSTSRRRNASFTLDP
ncbi:hypothetical protein FRB99_006311 [Tulasnella sp. 403]|nr:hypothetical protein FRB99_006311 [Tulasnella sp. 403]